MRTIIQLSDLHFGRVNPEVLAPLIACIHALAPDLIVVSGDLTQRARTEQFKQARRFLAALPQPQIVVPGNHDVPLFNVLARFFSPLTKYRRHITPDLQPVFIDDEVAVVGINTARSLVVNNGRVNDQQIEMARRQLAAAGTMRVKIIVTHHPFALPPGPQVHTQVGKAALAMRAFALCGADLLLAGHVHISSAVSNAEHCGSADYSPLVVQAGTATSSRGRGESNAFNVLRVEAHRIAIERMAWQPDQSNFARAAHQVFDQIDHAWIERI